MTGSLDLLLRMTVLAGLGIAAVWCARRQSAATRHLIAFASLASIAALAPLHAVLPSWNAAPPLAPAIPAVTDVAVSAIAVDAAREHARPTVDAAGWAAVVWAAGAAAGLLSLALGLWRLRQLRRQAESIPARWRPLLPTLTGDAGIGRTVEVRISPANLSPATWGVFRPTILLPAEARAWSEQLLSTVLRHELAHVRRHDWITQLCAEGLKSLLWFHPLVWLLCRRLRRESELACDDAVIESGVRPSDYATDLLAIARACRRPVGVALPMARSSTLEQRITAMLTSTVRRHRPSWIALVLTCLTCAAVTSVVAAVTAQDAGPMPLSGAVYDVSGAVLPDVKLKLTTPEKLQLEATTDAAGRYEFTSVGPGKYQLEATLPGFRTLEYELELRRDRDWMQIITLQVGTLQETITVQASPITTTTATPATPAPTPIRVGGNLRPPRKLKDVRPVYPVSMRAAGAEGVVTLEAIINTQGAVQSVRVLSGSVHPDLAIAAVDAVRQWRFEATLLNGKPVDVMMTTTVQFKLGE